MRHFFHSKQFRVLLGVCLALLLGVFALIPGVQDLNAGYLFIPRQLTLISSLTVGIPGFFLALEPSEERVKGSFLKTVLYRALPGGIAVTLCAFLSLLFAGEEMRSTLAVLSAGVVGFLVLVRTCLPLNKLRTVLIAVLIAAFIGIVLTAGPMLMLKPLDGKSFGLFVILAAVGCAVVLVSARVLKKKQAENV